PLAPAYQAAPAGAAAAAESVAIAFVRTSVTPVQNNLAALSRVGDGERFLVLLIRKAVGDHRRDVEAALAQDRRLVPGIEDLPAVDAFDGEHLEHDLRPVDGELMVRQAEH